MGWQADIQLQDLDAEERLHLTCRKCGYGWHFKLGDLPTHPVHKYLYVDEVPSLTPCPQMGCGSQDLRIARRTVSETETFTAGLP